MTSFETDKDRQKQFREMTKELETYIAELYDKIDKDHNANASQHSGKHNYHFYALFFGIYRDKI